MRKRSIFLWIATILATAYSVYMFIYFVGGTAASEGTDALAGTIATALVAPNMISFSIGSVFGWVSFGTKKSWAALVAAICYAAGALLFLPYAIVCVPLLILGFIGFAMQLRIEKKKNDETENAEV